MQAFLSFGPRVFPRYHDKGACMAAKRNPQTAAKREREQANREKRERKREKKAAAAAARVAGSSTVAP